jgi:hypothetical protein
VLEEGDHNSRRAIIVDVALRENVTRALRPFIIIYPQRRYTQSCCFMVPLSASASCECEWEANPACCGLRTSYFPSQRKSHHLIRDTDNDHIHELCRSDLRNDVAWQPHRTCHVGASIVGTLGTALLVRQSPCEPCISAFHG